MLLLIGSDVALLEGLAQLLAGSGHRVQVAPSLADAAELAHLTPPLLVVVDHALVVPDDGVLVSSLPLAAGGAFVLYRTTGAAGSHPTYTPGLTRHTLADLTLPLERQRLVTLAHYVRERARERGRHHVEAPPERPAP